MVNAVAFSPDGRRLASASRDKTIRIWDVRTGDLLQTLEGHTDSVSAVKFLSDGRRVVSASHTRNERMVRIWDASNGRLLRTLDQIGAATLEFTADGKTLAVGGASISLLDAETGALQKAMRGGGGGQAGAVVTIHPAPEGKWFAHVGSNIAVLDPESGHLRQIHRVPANVAVRSIGRDKSGRWLIPLLSGQTVTLWDAVAARAVSTVVANGLASPLGNRIAISPDGQRLATWTVAQGSNLGATVQIWNVASGKLERTIALPNQKSFIPAIAFTPDGRRLALGSLSASDDLKDNTLKVFDAASGRLVQSMSRESIWRISFSPDGRLIFASTGGRSGFCSF
jgi:WD40 repeat protein